MYPLLIYVGMHFDGGSTQISVLIFAIGCAMAKVAFTKNKKKDFLLGGRFSSRIAP